MDETEKEKLELFKKVMDEIREYCNAYLAKTGYCVSYYMLATYAYQEAKENWIAIIKDKNSRFIVREALKEWRRKARSKYEKNKSNSMEEYVSARCEYECKKEQKRFEHREDGNLNTQ